MNKFVSLAAGFYRLLLAAYPGGFRREFGAEMLEVFEVAIRQGVHVSWVRFIGMLWKEFIDWPVNVWREHRRIRKNNMINAEFKPLTKNELLAALALFLIPSLSALLTALVGTANFSNLPTWMNMFLVIFFLGSLITAFVLAIIKGFPRWSPPYLGVLLVGFVFFVPFWRIVGVIYPVYLRWFGPMNFWSLPVRIFYQGVNALIVWSFVLLTAYLLTLLLRMFSHTRGLWQRFRQDWTQFSFILYGGIILYTVLIFDEYQGDEFWKFLSWLFLGVGCWLYLRTSDQKKRFLVLLCGATLALWILAIGKWYLVPLQNWSPWFEQHPSESERWFEAGSVIADWLVLMVVMWIPALLPRTPQKPAPQEEPALA